MRNVQATFQASQEKNKKKIKKNILCILKFFGYDQCHKQLHQAEGLVPRIVSYCTPNVRLIMLSGQVARNAKSCRSNFIR